jgi:hypothetical protein
LEIEAESQTGVLLTLDEELAEIAKHKKICNAAQLEIVGDIYTHERFAVPFKSVNRETFYQFRDLVSFVNKHRRITPRQYYYHSIQTLGLDVSTSQKATNAYARIDYIINKARLGGIIPFNSIIDTTSLYGTQQYPFSIEHFLARQSLKYRSNWFENQECYVEVWIEKEALSRIANEIADTLGVFVSCSGGRNTWSQIHSAIRRFNAMGKETNYILYFGDLDPIGKDILQWLRETFPILKCYNVEIEEVALNIRDVERFNLTRLPLKSHQKQKNMLQWYKDNYCEYGTELDALEPDILKKKIETAILGKLEYETIMEKQTEDSLAIKRIGEKLKRLETEDE